MTDSPPPLPRIAIVLGVAGLAPQVLALAATFTEAHRYTGLAAGYFYAALIFSFLGGLWWGVAASRKDAPEWLYLAAVVPSLIAFASGIPWMTGSEWPGPSLGVLGIGILASLLADRAVFKAGLIDRSLMRLRFGLSLGLGAMTLLLATR
jgi:Protein of unknown function (DUF3429)